MEETKINDVHILHEKVQSDFDGTIIDLETIGSFNQGYKDSRLYKNQKITVFGFITNSELKLLYARTEAGFKRLNQEINQCMALLPKPWASFNASFEMGVLFHNTSGRYIFERELQEIPFESKLRAVASLRLGQYDDPFNDNGKLCIDAWNSGEIDKILAHNRADLLKERDILVKRGHRKADELVFVE